MIRTPEDRALVRAIRRQQLAEAVEDLHETGDKEAAETVALALDRLDAAHRDSHPDQMELHIGG